MDRKSQKTFAHYFGQPLFFQEEKDTDAQLHFYGTTFKYSRSLDGTVNPTKSGKPSERDAF